MKRKTDTLIIGAGISGCAAAHELQTNGVDYLLLEKNVEPGGLCRSISVGDAHFDYSGHYLHLAQYKSPSEIPYANQNDKEWQIVERKSAVYVDGNLIPAPFQYNLYALPQAMRRRCINGFRSRPLGKRIRSFRDYLLSGFGKGICEAFLFPYNTKQLATPLDELSVDAVKRFFPYPDEENIENGYARKDMSSLLGYNNHFWYPKNSGIGLLARGLADGLSSLQTGCTVKKINLNSKRAYTSLGEVCFERLLTSMPLKFFCAKTTDPQLESLADSLNHNRVLCLNLLLRDGLPANLKGCHWIYIADNKIPFYRIGIYSNIPTRFAPHLHTSMYLEVAYSHVVRLPSLDSVVAKSLESLEKLGWVHRRDCLVMSANWIECGYVHFTHSRQETLNHILGCLKNHHVYLIGRYGQWDYLSMEDSISSGIRAAQELKNG